MNNQTEVKTKPSFGVLWQKYGTMGIFLLLLAVLTIAKPSSIFNPDSIPQILKQSAVNILLALGGRTLHPDELVEATGIPARRVLSALTMLQLRGYVEERPGKRFEALVLLRTD